jgi:glucose/arabinose dehydrogenase
MHSIRGCAPSSQAAPPCAAVAARATQVLTVASGLNMPNGAPVRDGAPYVAEASRILRFEDIESRLDNPPRPVIVSDRLPTGRHHG